MASVKLTVEALPPFSRGETVQFFSARPPLFGLDPERQNVQVEETQVPLLDLGERIVPGLTYRLRIGAYCPTRDPNEIRIVVGEGAMELQEADALRMPTLISSLYYERKRATIAEVEARWLREERHRLLRFETSAKKAEERAYAESWADRWVLE